MSRPVKINERGRRIGESHPRAVLTDHEVEYLLMPLLEQREALVAERRAVGVRQADIDIELRRVGLSFRLLAEKFDVSKGHIAKIAKGVRRGQVAVTVKG